MAKNFKKQKEKTNPVLWFLFAIVIPLIVAVTLAVIIFTVAGVDVMAWAKKTGNNIPVLTEVITTEKEQGEQRLEEKLNDTIAAKDEEISQLNRKVTNLESTIDEQEQEIVKFEKNTSNASESAASSEERTETVENKSVKSIASSFQDMDNEQAAKIIQNLKQGLSVTILKKLPNDTRGSILEAMEPDKAAELTQLFVNSTE